MSIKPIIQQITAKQQALEKGVTQMQTEKMRGIEAKADAFLTASDPIGFIGKLASESPDEIAPVVNAARRKKKEVMQAQAPQQETVFNAGLRSVFELSRPQQQPQQQQPQQPPPNPRQMAVAGLPIRPDMFKAGGGIVAFSGHDGSFVRQQRLAEAEKRRLGNLQNQVTFTSALLGQFPGTQTVLDSVRTLPNNSNLRPLDDVINPVGRGEDNNPLANAKLLDASAEVKAEPIYDEKTGKVIYPEGYTDIKEGTPPERAAVRDYLAEGERKGFLPEKGEKPTAEQERGAAEYFAEQRAAREIPKPRPTDEDLLGRPEGEIEGLGDVVVDMADKTQAIMDSIGLQKPEAFKPDDFSVENTRRLFTDAGVNLDLLSDQARKLGDEKLKLKEDKKEALAFFGLEAGLLIIAGKDPNALVNIGAGAGKAIAPLRKELTRLKDQHNSLRKEENQLARMQSQQDMGIAKFSQERLNDARKSYDANLRNYNTTRAQIANRVLTDNSALQRVKISAGATVKSSQMRADATQNVESRIVELQKLRDSYPEGSPKRIQIEKALAELMGFKQSLKAPSRQAVIDAYRNMNKSGSGGSFTPDPEKDAYLKSQGYAG